MSYQKETIDDYDLFISNVIGEKRWAKIPAIKKLQVLKKFAEIQDIAKTDYFS